MVKNPLFILFSDSEIRQNRIGMTDLIDDIFLIVGSVRNNMSFPPEYWFIPLGNLKEKLKLLVIPVPATAGYRNLINRTN